MAEFRVAVAGAAAWAMAALAATAQTAPQHGPGRVIPAGDFDGDGRGDLWIHDGETLQAWTGAPAAPWLRQAAGTAFETDARLASVVWAGRHLFAAEPGGSPRELRVPSWAVGPTGAPVERREQFLASDDPDAEITAVRIAPLGFDHDGDGHDDVVVLHREEYTRGRGRFFASYVGRVGATRPCWIPLLGDGERPMACVGLSATASLAQPGDETVLVVTSADGQSGHGFAVASIGPGTNGEPQLRSTFEVPFAPPLHVPGALDLDASALFTNADPARALAMPLLRLSGGASFVLHASTFAPWVTAAGVWVHTSAAGYAIPGSAADYDGDGSAEVVFLETLPALQTDIVAIAGPHVADRNHQAMLWPSFELPGPPRDRGHLYDVAHAAPVDVDGDGDPDLVMSLRTPEQSGSSGIAVFRAEPVGSGPMRQLVRVR